MVGRILQACTLALTLLPSAAEALILDWDTNPWPDTSTFTQTYMIGAGDVIVTILDPNGVLNPNPGPLGSPASPATSSYLDPVGNGGQANLFIKTAGNGSAPWVTILFDFTHAGGVTDVSFSLYDVDLGFGYIDEIQLSATDGTSTYDPASVVPPSPMPSWTWDGAGLVSATANAPQTGPGSDNGTAQVLFAVPVSQVRIEYRNTFFLPFSQWVGISDISFQTVPEPGSLQLTLFGLVLLATGRRPPIPGRDVQRDRPPLSSPVTCTEPSIRSM